LSAEKQPIVYPLIDPPFKVKLLDEMTRAEAKTLLAWWCELPPSRIALLQELCARFGLHPDAFDYSPDSLKEVWPTIWRIIELSQRRKDRNAALVTKAVALDTSFYFAEVLIRRYECVSWDVFAGASRRHPHRKPFLRGFKCYEYPNDCVHACLYESMTKRNDLALYEAYLFWSKYLVSKKRRRQRD